MDKRQTPIARKLRTRSTDAETLPWQHLRAHRIEGAKFVRQFPIGPHVADFRCRAARLVIELDGGQHATSVTEAGRTALIQEHGYTVLRFWNNEVIENIEGVLEEIAHTLRLARA